MFSHVAGTAGPDRAAPGGQGALTGPRNGEPCPGRWRPVVLLLIGIIGCCVSIAMFVAIDGWESHVAELRFYNEARDRLRTINSGLNDATDLLWSMRAYLETMRHPVSRAEYVAFSGALRSRVVGLRDTGWAPRVTSSGRDAFEREVRATGLPDFQIVRQGLEMDLRDAIEHDRLELYYQPRVCIADGRITGFEALLRWHHPIRGLFSPGDFMRCAEDTGLIVAVGTWAMDTALIEAARWPPGVRVAVNLSPRQVADDGLSDMIEAALAVSGQTGARLELEITEIALVRQHAAAHAALKRLQGLGVLITMDNYGIGHASLSRLRSFPFDRIKIDRSFVGGMTESPEGDAVLRAILRLAGDLSIATTAEGVETRAQLEQLAANGCTDAQGYLFSPPRPAGELSCLLAGWSPSAPARNVAAPDLAVGDPLVA
jgi:EAL domain-containing protein (putative c-di-GMP-specific phosphodiesterase class I)